MTASLNAAMAQLSVLLARETDAIERLDHDAVAAFYPEKKRLIELVQAGSPRSEPPVADGTMVASLRQEVERNGAALQRAMLVQRQVFGVIARSVVRPPMAGYAKNGHAADTSARMPVALASSA